MSDELPDVFRQVQPRRAPDELRQRVLAAVEPHLVRRKKPRWERTIELAVAASLALGVGLNVVAGPLGRGVAHFGNFRPDRPLSADGTRGAKRPRRWRRPPANGQSLLPSLDRPVAFTFRLRPSKQYQQLLDELTSGKGRGAL